MKNVFVDLDETLIHVCDFSRQSDIPKQNLAVDQGQITIDDICYVAELRPGALELLHKIREIVSKEKVFMLTASIEQYACHWNEFFDLGFNTKQIYHRTDIRNRIAEPLDITYFQKAEVCLIDNLPRHDNFEKIQFLKVIDPKMIYIQISEFIRSPDHNLTRDEIDEIISCIVHRTDRRINYMRVSKR